MCRRLLRHVGSKHHSQRGGAIRAADLAGIDCHLLFGQMAHEEPGPDQQKQEEGHREGGGYPEKVSRVCRSGGRRRSIGGSKVQKSSEFRFVWGWETILGRI